MKRFEAIRVHDIQAPLPFPAHLDKPSSLEHLKVLRDGLLGDVEVGGYLADRTRTAHQPQDGSAARLCQSAERGLAVHGLDFDRDWLLQQALTCESIRFSIVPRGLPRWDAAAFIRVLGDR